MPLKVIITGATGFIGRRLTRALIARGAEVTALTRDPARARQYLPESVSIHTWDPLAGPTPTEALEGKDAVVNLAGETIGSPRWTAGQMRRIRESRIVGTRNLVAGIERTSIRPRVLVSGSGTHYYGDRGDDHLDETSPGGGGFLAEVVVAWEAEAVEAQSLGVRVVLFRSGPVLGPGGGMLQPFLLPFQLGLGATFGSGRQWLPWIQIEDEIGLILHSLEHQEIVGPLNATAPNPATNLDFTRAFARALNRPAIFTLPTFLVELGMGAASEMMLMSQRVFPAKALATGYRFVYPELLSALATSAAR